jgi:hypothetical protein
MARQHAYEVLVSAKTSDEAIEIASEAIPPHRKIVRSEAADASAEEGPNSFRVSIWFEGSGDEGPAG